MAAGHDDLCVQGIYCGLKKSRRKGARAPRLRQYVPELVDLLFPAGSYPDVDADELAFWAENLIREAIAVMGGTIGQAMAVLLCLRPGLSSSNLTERRRLAAQCLGVEARTFSKPYLEPTLLRELAAEIFRLRAYGNSEETP